MKIIIITYDLIMLQVAGINIKKVNIVINCQRFHLFISYVNLHIVGNP